MIGPLEERFSHVFEPVVDWIGDWPVSHGERDVEYGGSDYLACLCGVRIYTCCPDWLNGAGIEGLTVLPGGELTDGWGRVMTEELFTAAELAESVDRDNAKRARDWFFDPLNDVDITDTETEE